MNAWITHVKDVAAKNGISYREALRSAETKATYKKGNDMPEMEMKPKRVRKGKGIPTMESSQAMLAQDEQVRDLAPVVLAEQVRKPRVRKAVAM
jgi:hypothetical protein